MEEEEKNNSNKNERSEGNDVIVTIYVESMLGRRQKPKRQLQLNPKRPWQQSPSTQGYNRKAQLLAYTQQLRRSSLQQNPRVRRKWRLKRKPTWEVLRLKFRVWIRQLFLPVRRRSAHCKLVSEEKISKRRTNEASKAKSQGNCSPHFRRFKSILKELRCIWKCSKR